MTPGVDLTVHHEVVRYVEFARRELGLAPADMRVLDYGCGEGDAVLTLRRKGYQAYGADIWAEGLEVARATLREAGIDLEGLFSVVDADGRTTFPDGQFHFISSQQVFEHVEDLNLVGRELRRLTAPGGLGFHVFPPRRRPLEGHYGLWFVHWLPKNRLRYVLLRAYTALGLGLRPQEIPDAGPRERAAFLYNYSVKHTFYRRPVVVAETLQRAGLDTCFAITNHRKLRANPVLRRVVDLPGLRGPIEWALLTFGGVNVLTRRAASFGAAPTIRFGNWTGHWRLARATEPAPTRPANARPQPEPARR